MKYEAMIQNLKSERIGLAVSTAARMYLAKGISEVKMTDIADQAQIGVASLYRYFGTKQLFTVKVAAYIWKMTLQELESVYTGPHYEALTGLEQAAALLNIFPVFLEEYKPFLRFLSEFDTFVIRERLEREHLREYESCSLNIRPVMIRAIEKGKADGTVRQEIDPELYYRTVADCLVSMCQQFAWGNTPHSEDPEMNRQTLELSIEMFLSYIRAS